MRVLKTRRLRWTDSPIRFGAFVSIVISVVVNVLGFWDIEDMLTYFYSTGSDFGGLFNGAGSSQELVHRVLGVPLLDFGIIGGYRLPYQGTINTGPLWALSSLLSAQLIIFLTHLMGMIASGVAFGHFWKQLLPSTEPWSTSSKLIFVALLSSANFPTLEYVLDQDWYSNSLAYHGFFTIASALFSLIVLIRNNSSGLPDTNYSLRLVLLGTYILLLGLWSYLPLYVPPLSVLAIFTAVSAYRRRLIRRILCTFFGSPVNALMFVVVFLSMGFVVMDVSSELSNRSIIDRSGVDYWWADPNRSLSDFLHFSKQLFATETYPWSALVNSLLGGTLGIPSDLTRIPHSALIAISLVAFETLRRRQLHHRPLIITILVIWSVSFLQMIHILPNLLRIRSDSFFRDILLSFAMFATGFIVTNPLDHASSPSGQKRTVLLPAVIVFTSLAVSLSYPLHHLSAWQRPSPYGLLGFYKGDNSWSENLHDALGAKSGVIAVVDPTFLNQWTEFLRQREDLKLIGTGADDLVPKDWRGLYGSFQLRQAGFTLLEGQPKIRDATAFTGLVDSLKQSLETPTIEYCKADLFGFLGVTDVVGKPGLLDQCRKSLESAGDSDSDVIEIGEISPLADSGLSFVQLSSDAVYESTSFVARDDELSRCGLLADSSCITTLQIRPSAGWAISPQPCRLPCVYRLSRTGNSVGKRDALVLPVNASIPLAVTDEMKRPLMTRSMNGLLAIPTTELNEQEIFVSVRTDIRMLLQIMVAYGQYAVVGLAISGVFLRKLQESRLKKKPVHE